SNFVTTGFWNFRFPKASQQRPYDHDGTAQCRCLFFKIGGINKIKIYFISFKYKFTVRFFFHVHTHVLQQLNELVYITYIGNVTDGNFFRCKKGCADNLQGLILGSLRSDFSLQFSSSGNFKTRVHWLRLMHYELRRKNSVTEYGV